MSGSALDQLKDLMSMIDKFELDIKSQSKNNQQQKPVIKQQQQASITSNENIPSILIQSNIPLSHQKKFPDNFQTIFPHTTSELTKRFALHYQKDT